MKIEKWNLTLQGDDGATLNETILAWPRLDKSGNTKLGWLWLWQQAGRREATIVSSAAAVTAALGCSDSRTGRAILQGLQAIGAVVILDSDLAGKGRLRGRCRIHVLDPRRVPQSRPPGLAGDPQIPLIEDAVERRLITAHPAICAHKSPAAICAHKSPDRPAAKRTQDQPSQPLAHDRPSGDPAICAHKSPLASSNEETNEEKQIHLTPKRIPNGTIGTKEEEIALIGAEMPAAQRGSAYRRRLRDEPAFRRVERERIKARLIAEVGERPDWWVAGAFADLVVKWGYPLAQETGAEEDCLELLVEELRRRKALPAGQGRIDNPAGWLQAAFSRRALKLGMKK